MTEDPQGNLYASEYSIGGRDDKELYAYNIWTSDPEGLHWRIFFEATHQQLERPEDPKNKKLNNKTGIRHVHLIAADHHGRLYTSFGGCVDPDDNNHPFSCLEGYGGEANSTYELLPKLDGKGKLSDPISIKRRSMDFHGGG
jgi:hypothetical protein